MNKMSGNSDMQKKELLEAVILAGGFGTRLRPVMAGVPKPMMPLAGRPFLAYLFDYLNAQSVARLIISTGYKHEVIEDYFAAAYKTMQLAYSVEKEPLGTGGAIKKALEICSADNVIILNGDTFFPIDLPAMLRHHIAAGADLTIALKKMTNFERYGTVTTAKERIVAFHDKKACAAGVINGGVYVVRRDLFQGFEMPEQFSFEADFLAKYPQQLLMAGFMSKAYFIDIGVPEDYEKATIECRTWLGGE